MIWHPAKEATPEIAASGLVVHDNVAPAPGWVAMARVIGALELVTVLPPLSSTVTTGWVVQATPLAPPLGWVVTASWVAAPTVMVKALVVALVSPAEVALSV